MTPIDDLVIPPPSPKVFDYPASIGVGLCIVFTSILLVVASRYDPTGGSLTISLIIVLTFIGVVTSCLFFTVPSGEVTSAILGGLTAAFGAVVSYWLNHPSRGPPP